MSDHADFIKAVINYTTQKFGQSTKVLEIKDLGSGLVADAYKVSISLKDGNRKDLVFRRLHGTGMSNDYLSDRIGYLLLQHEIAQHHPKHTKSLDVVVYGKELDTISVDGISDTFQVMEFSHGESYLKFIKKIGDKKELTKENRQIIEQIGRYLYELHSSKPIHLSENVKKHLYWRHSQDFIASEVYLDIMDVWPNDQHFDTEKKAEILKKLFLHRERTMDRYSRITKIHADFHPDNIRVKDDRSIEVLDATRTKWGEAADDVASILANFIYYSIRSTKSLKGNYKEAYNLLTEQYLTLTADEDIQSLIPMYLAVRLLIVAHPVFFVDNTSEDIDLLIELAEDLLAKEEFEFDDIFTLI